MHSCYLEQFTPARHFCTFVACLPVTPQDHFLTFTISYPPSPWPCTVLAQWHVISDTLIVHRTYLLTNCRFSVQRSSLNSVLTSIELQRTGLACMVRRYQANDNNNTATPVLVPSQSLWLDLRVKGTEGPTDTLDIIIVPYELYELYDWGKVPELYGTL